MTVGSRSTIELMRPTYIVVGRSTCTKHMLMQQASMTLSALELTAATAMPHTYWHVFPQALHNMHLPNQDAVVAQQQDQGNVPPTHHQSAG